MNLRTPFSAIPMFEPTRAIANEGYSGVFHGSQGTAISGVEANQVTAALGLASDAVEVQSTGYEAVQPA